MRIAIIKEITRKFVQKIPKNSNGAEIKHLRDLEQPKASMLRYGGPGHEIQRLSRISSPTHASGARFVRLLAFQVEQSPSSIHPYEMGFLFPPSLWMRVSSCMAIKPFP